MANVARGDELETIDLPAGAAGGWVRYFRGEAYGVGLSLLRSKIMPGHGAPPHTHEYDEIFIVHAGRGRFTVGDQSIQAGPGDVVAIPSGMPHAFVGIGDEPLEQTSVHRNAVFAQTVLGTEDAG